MRLSISHTDNKTDALLYSISLGIIALNLQLCLLVGL